LFFDNMTKQTILPLSSLPNFNGFSPHQPVNGIHTPFSHAQHTQTHHHPHSCECTHIHPKASHQQQQLAAHAEFVLSSVFSLKLLIRLLAYHPRAFLQSSWNVLDLVLVMTSFIACLSRGIASADAANRAAHIAPAAPHSTHLQSCLAYKVCTSSFRSTLYGIALNEYGLHVQRRGVIHKKGYIQL